MESPTKKNLCELCVFCGPRAVDGFSIPFNVQRYKRESCSRCPSSVGRVPVKKRSATSSKRTIPTRNVSQEREKVGDGGMNSVTHENPEFPNSSTNRCLLVWILAERLVYRDRLTKEERVDQRVVCEGEKRKASGRFPWSTKRTNCGLIQDRQGFNLHKVFRKLWKEVLKGCRGDTNGW